MIVGSQDPSELTVFRVIISKELRVKINDYICGKKYSNDLRYIRFIDV
jgi:hypothetical protein